MARITTMEFNGTALECPDDNEQIFDQLNSLLLKMKSLDSIVLMGTCIAERIGSLIPVLRQPQIKSITLPYNGITQNCFVSFFKHVFNFETIQELNLSSNWFSTNGLFEVKDELCRFTRLKKLSIATSKLCFGHPENYEPALKLSHVLANLSYLEELDLAENSINEAKFCILAPSLAAMSNLKCLNLSKNPIQYKGIEALLKTIVKGGPSALQSLNLTGCFLQNEGVCTLLKLVASHQSCFRNLRNLTLTAN